MEGDGVGPCLGVFLVRVFFKGVRAQTGRLFVDCIGTPVSSMQ